MLAAAGIEASHLREIAAFIAETEEDQGKRRKYLASVLVAVELVKTALAGIAEHRERAARESAANPEQDAPAHAVNMPVGALSCPCPACCLARSSQPPPEPWDHDRQCRIAASLVTSDRRSREEVAQLLGVSETTLELMVARGQQWRALPPWSEPATMPSASQRNDDASEDERRKAFREQMRRARQVAT